MEKPPADFYVGIFCQQLPMRDCEGTAPACQIIKIRNMNFQAFLNILFEICHFSAKKQKNARGPQVRCDWTVLSELYC